MSVPPELRSICSQLSTISPAELPLILPSLQHDILRCRVPLSAPSAATGKDLPESSVLVHKLKTQLTTLLQGKSAEGRFVAAVLIKGAIDVGGWEVLRGADGWTRGLLAILSKADSAATKQICVLSLTNIYLETHQYQTLIREITTPTLPTYVTSCLKLITSKATGRPLAVPQALLESILESFAALVSRHPTIFRPLANQIRAAIKPYLAPTRSDGRFVPAPIQQSAQKVSVVLHLTAAKNGGAEDWVKAVNATIKEIHQTSDLVFRPVIEDWESTAGYTAQSVDINQALAATSEQELPQWTGIQSGIERLAGLLRFLGAHFKYQTATAVNVPLEAVIDLVTRVLSVEPSTGPDSGASSTRARPGIEKHEREGLWAGLPILHTEALQLLTVVVNRLQTAFSPLALQCLEQIFWLFSSAASTSKSDEDFRTAAYRLIAELLEINGKLISRPQIRLFIPAIQACCEDLSPSPSKDESRTAVQAQPGAKKNGSAAAIANADSFLQIGSSASRKQSSELVDAAAKVLPYFLSHLSQQHLDISTRSLIDRTAILTQNKDAMLASVLNPFVGRNKRALASILPHVKQAFPNDLAVEGILRPRLPPRPPPNAEGDLPYGDNEDEEEEEDGDAIPLVVQSKRTQAMEDEPTYTVAPTSFDEPAATSSRPLNGFASVVTSGKSSIFSATNVKDDGEGTVVVEKTEVMEIVEPEAEEEATSVVLPADEDDDSDGDSVHLNMEMSESEAEE